ncbi:MAG: asparagine synthase C-terminal domain-containing protein [Burkholderiaceae bacterium]|nr:asparagine synthase C-terminal domain-containing protein [Burkholderiaceae bacterium]
MKHSRLPIPFGGTIDSATGRVDLAPDPATNSAPGRSLVQRAGSGALVFGRLRFLDSPLGEVLRDPAQALLDAWQQRGDEVLGSIAGEFLIALWDAERRRALLAVDRFSTFPLFFCEQPGRIGFGARPADAANRADVAAEVDWQAAFDYAYFHMIPAPYSICRGVRRLDLGEALRIERGAAELVRWWQPVFDEHRPFDFEREKGEFLDALARGVAECTAGHARERIGCFLSGGTDSSTIAGLVTKQYGAPARTFSIGFDVGGYDESHYSRLAAKHFGTDHTEYYLTPDDVSNGVEAVATQYEQPFGNSSAVPTFFCASLAREAGVARMLGGDGGDELYGGNERYAKQAVFALYDRVPGPMRAALVEPLLFGAMRGVDAKYVAKARSYVEQAKEPLPDRLQARYNLLNRLGATRVFTDRFLADVRADEPLALEREVWQRARAAEEPMSQIDKLLAWDFKFTLADSDLPKVTRMCHAAGVEVCFPMLTQALVEHSLRLAPEQKLKGRRLRHFFRESLRGFLPDEIIDKKKQGFGVPFGDWLLTHERLRATADDALRSLSARGVIRGEFLDALLAHLKAGHAGYYGTMVWVLMILELWLRASPMADERVRH